MVKEQFPYIDEEGKEYPNLIKHYSDENKMIKQIETGNLYSEAIDLYPCRYKYTETDIPIEAE